MSEEGPVFSGITNGTLWFQNPVGRVFTQTCINFTDVFPHVVEWMKLEKGVMNTPCPVPDYGLELQRCKYYFEKLDYYYGHYCNVAGTIYLTLKFNEKRIIPTTKYHDWLGGEEYIHYQPIGQGGTDQLSDTITYAKQK